MAGRSPASAQCSCASIPAIRVRLPSHQGHLTSLRVSSAVEITMPVPRQAIHSRDEWASSA